LQISTLVAPAVRKVYSILGFYTFLLSS